MPSALAGLGAGLAREMRDRAAADGCLPANARHLRADGARGWLYEVTSEDGDRYRLFLYFDGADLHACHVFAGGLVCFGTADAGGMPSLESAYARSVLWANGYSAWLRTGRFPF